MVSEASDKKKIAEKLKKAKLYIESKISEEQKEGIEILEELAEEENAEACFIIGKCYLDGCAVQKNSQEAETYLEEAASLGHAEAQLLLGRIYYKTGSRLRRKRAISLFRQAAENMLPEAMYIYAVYLLGNEDSESEGLKVMQGAAGQQHAKACTYLGIYEDCKGNFDGAFDYYKKAAETDIQASRLLADRYMYDDIPEAERKILSCEKTDEEYKYSIQLKAYNLYKKASEKGDAASTYHYAICCRDSIYKGAAQNMTLAIENLWRAAEKGYRPAIEYLKELCKQENLVKHFGHDGIGRIAWLDKKAANISADMEFSKGNHEKAYEFYDANSMKNIYSKIRKAYCLMFGYGTEKKPLEAVRLLEEITGSSRTERNPLAHYLLSYYYMCVEIDRITDNNLLEDDDKDKRKKFAVEKALKHHRFAKSSINYSYNNSEEFQNVIKQYLDNTDLEYKIAEITNTVVAQDDFVEIKPEDDVLWTEETRQENLLIFLQGLKSRMKYEYLPQNTYGKYANGSRPINKEDILIKIAFDAQLSVEECKQLFSLAKMTFEPLKYAEHKNLADVLSGEYRNLLNQKELKEIDEALIEPLQLAYEFVNKAYFNSKIKKVGL